MKDLDGILDRLIAEREQGMPRWTPTPPPTGPRRHRSRPLLDIDIPGYHKSLPIDTKIELLAAAGRFGD